MYVAIQNEYSACLSGQNLFLQIMSGVTLNELCTEVGVTLTQLDKPCTSEHIQDIALFLESWRSVASRLGLSDAEVEAAKMNATSEEERRQKILATWKAKFAFKAKYRVLIEALLKIGRADQAEKVCRVLVPEQPIEGVSYLILHDLLMLLVQVGLVPSVISLSLGIVKFMEQEMK